jgi:hypothetical protein
MPRNLRRYVMRDRDLSMAGGQLGNAPFLLLRAERELGLCCIRFGAGEDPGALAQALAGRSRGARRESAVDPH